ncbi:hypothetical protein HGM15179_009580, partial [Zosterops borbonicus]
LLNRRMISKTAWRERKEERQDRPVRISSTGLSGRIHLQLDWKPEILTGDPCRLSRGNPPRETADLGMDQSSHQGI